MIESARREMMRRPFPQAHCECPAIHVLTCTEARGEAMRCDCECHTLWSMLDGN